MDIFIGPLTNMSMNNKRMSISFRKSYNNEESGHVGMLLKKLLTKSQVRCPTNEIMH